MIRLLIVLSLFVFQTGIANAQTEVQDNSATKSKTQIEDTNQPVTQSEISEEFRKDIRTLMDHNKHLNNTYASIFNVYSMLKKRAPGVPATFWDNCQSMISKDTIAKLLTKEYAVQYTHQDIKDLIVFYESNVGKKFVRATKQISLKSQKSIQVYTKDLIKKVKDQLDAAGYKW